VPTRDNAGDVAVFVESLLATAAAPASLRILVIDNGGRDPAMRRMLEDLADSGSIRLVTVDEPFNWARLNNQAARLASEPLLVFANDDMRMLTPRWDARLRGLLTRPEVGAVGARLMYDDDTIQHAGILCGWKGSVIHDGLYESLDAPGPAGRWHVTRAVSAVTGAFLATRREAFTATGGFDEVGLPVAYSDIDYAFRLRAAGMKVLWTPRITLYHFESKTRGVDYANAAKAARYAAERGTMEQRWGAALDSDPSVNPIWYDGTLPFRLITAVPAGRALAHVVRCGGHLPWKP
jgi:GT2 family glycosyltransferase